MRNYIYLRELIFVINYIISILSDPNTPKCFRWTMRRRITNGERNAGLIRYERIDDITIGENSRYTNFRDGYYEVNTTED